jgi:hypothetical protein
MSQDVAGKRVMIPNLYTIKYHTDTEGEMDKKDISERRVTDGGTRS